jgi:hypothetical protein
MAGDEPPPTDPVAFAKLATDERAGASREAQRHPPALWLDRVVAVLFGLGVLVVLVSIYAILWL